MYARVTTSQTTPDCVEALIAYVRTLIPAVKQIPGVTAYYALADRQGGKGLSITIYENEEALRAADERAEQLRTGATQEIGSAIVSVETYEVVGQM